MKQEKFPFAEESDDHMIDATRYSIMAERNRKPDPDAEFPWFEISIAIIILGVIWLLTNGHT